MEKHILLAVLAELEVFSTLDETLLEKEHPYVCSVRHVGIPYRPAVWFGGPLSGRRRKSLTRATRNRRSKAEPGVGNDRWARGDWEL